MAKKTKWAKKGQRNSVKQQTWSPREENVEGGEGAGSHLEVWAGSLGRRGLGARRRSLVFTQVLEHNALFQTNTPVCVHACRLEWVGEVGN